jgi:hypothetical protein
MKKAILFLVALILLSFITNAGVGDHKESKIEYPIAAYSIYRLHNTYSTSEFVQSDHYFIKTNLSLVTPNTVELTIGIVAKTNQSCLCTKLSELTPTVKTSFLICLRSKNNYKNIPIADITIERARYNYLPVLISLKP